MFYIVDAGRRIHTPIDHLLQPLRVGATAATRPVASTSATPSAVTTDSRQAQVSAAYANTAELDADGQQRRPQRLQLAGELMNPARCARLTDTIGRAWEILLGERFHHLPVVDVAGELRGIVSDRDLLRVAASHSREETSSWLLEQVMQPRVIAAGATASLRSLAEVMAGRRIGAIPVVDERNQVIGIITRADLLRALVHQAPLELWG